jgi:hypothetical protein
MRVDALKSGAEYSLTNAILHLRREHFLCGEGGQSEAIHGQNSSLDNKLILTWYLPAIIVPGVA